MENSLLTTPLKRELDVKPTLLSFNNPQIKSSKKVSQMNSPVADIHHQHITEENNSTREEQPVQQTIEELYENIRVDMNAIKGDTSPSKNVDSLQSKLETIRRNKAMLEAKMREYDKKKIAVSQLQYHR